MLGHYARDCSKEIGTGMPRSAPLNMLSAQELSQEHYTLIASLQNQVSLQQQLLSAQATLARQDECLTNALGALGHPFHAGATMPPGVGTSLAATAPLAAHKPPSDQKYYGVAMAPLLQPVSYQRSVPDSRSFFFVTHVFAMFCDQETYGTDKFTAYSKGKLFNKQLFRRVNFPIQFRRMSM